MILCVPAAMCFIGRSNLAKVSRQPVIDNPGIVGYARFVVNYERRCITMNTAELKKFCTEVRRDIINMTANAGSGHPGGSLSAVELMSGIFSKMRVDPKDPKIRTGTGSFSARATPLPAITACWRSWAFLTRRSSPISGSSTAFSRATRI